jgi:hypothetical protein
MFGYDLTLNYLWYVNEKLKTKAMKTKISKSDFTFTMVGYGRYSVTYQSPITGKKWTTQTTSPDFIDEVKNRDYPTKRLLESLRWACKNM